MPLREERLLEEIKSVSLFGYVQCDVEEPKNPREVFANLPPMFKNIKVGKVDIGPIMNTYVEKEGILTQPRRMLISSHFSKKGTIVTPLQLFCLDLGLVCKKKYRFVQYTMMKCFNSSV